MALDVALEVAKAAGDTALARAREPVLLLDSDLRVLRANRAFADWFALGDRRVEGEFVYELGDGQWSTGELRRLLEQVLPEKTSVEGFSLERSPGSGDGKRLVVDARRIDIGRRKQGLIILVVREDAAGNAA